MVGGVVTVSIWSLEGNILVIAEKPKAARKIAYALSSRPARRILYRIPYYQITYGRATIIVASAAGHLYGLATEERGYPVFTYQWKPLYLIDKSAAYTKNYLMVLQKLCRIADKYVNACDYDIEGSVIGYLIIKYHGDPNRSFRAKYSSLTPKELRESFKNLTVLDWDMIEAGTARHELDWIWGINISRALMDAVREVSGRRIVLSAGRVQTPTLRHVVEKNIERNLYIPLPEYTISVSIMRNNAKIRLEYHGRTLETRRKAEKIIQELKTIRQLKVQSIESKRITLRNPPAFNLGDLQGEAARIYGFSPYKTQSIAEKLYLDALISYPRTNSEKLPPTLDYNGILQRISEISSYGKLISNLMSETRGILKPRQGPKDDPAHPAIYPTGVKPTGLKPDEWKIYDLIVRRFIAAFSHDAILEHTTVTFIPVGRATPIFTLTGQSIVEEGWLKYYPFSRPQEHAIPVFAENEVYLISDARVRRTFTKPPEKITRMKILRWMENNEIGTEATRARIIETLFKRSYLVSRPRGVEASDLGVGVIEVLMEYFPEITRVDLTRYFEKQMNMIREGKVSRGKVVDEAKNTLINLLGEFENRKREIGRMLAYRLGIMKPARKCILCEREEYRDGLCKYHYEALKRIREAYSEWKRREEITWSEYLRTLLKLRSTGRWVREVLEAVENRIFQPEPP
jgi:DNA topoisomerase-1